LQETTTHFPTKGPEVHAHRFNITVKIWLSVGVFILGYVLSTALSQMNDRGVRTLLRTTSSALFPAAQQSQEAESAFHRMVKGFSDAVVMQDTSGLDRAAENGSQTVAALRAAAAIPGVSGERAAQAANLANLVERLLGDARTLYEAVLAGTLTAATHDQMRSLATRTDEINKSLAQTKEQFAADLQGQVNSLEQRSARQSSVALAVFLITLIVAGVVVHLTIRKAITGPVTSVIDGVKDAADEAARAARQVANSGTAVSENAREQLACIEETSASLEEISTATRQNAQRAKEADRQMQAARSTGERAAHTMRDLTASMALISNRSNQVASVLKSIDQIAFQTNILALNAAVEAARAGEAGAGFSVVADEVRSLARRSAEAARDSGAIMEQTVLDVSTGVKLAGNARTAFEEVSAKIASGTKVVTLIAASSAEQAVGVTAVGKALTRIESLTQRNVANAEETAGEAAAMTSQVANTRKYLDVLVSVVGLHRP
jgi:hypothetical protein